MKIKRLDKELDPIFSQLEKDIKSSTKLPKSSYNFSLDAFYGSKNRYKDDLRIIKENYKSGGILDIGSAPYHLIYCLRKMGFSITGLDINPDEYKTFIQKHDLKIIKADIEIDHLPFKDNTFDFIIFNEVFEHMRINPIFTLREINRILKPQGILMLTTPNLYALHKIIMFNLGMGFNDPYLQFEILNKAGYMGHIREYSTREVKRFLENTGFKIFRVEYGFYTTFFQHPDMNTPLKKIVALMLDLCMSFFPKLRTYQKILAHKKT